MARTTSDLAEMRNTIDGFFDRLRHGVHAARGTLNEYYRQKRQHLIRERGSKCAVCGSRENLDFAHVLPTKLSGTGRGANVRTIDLIEHPSAYTLLCRSCHEEMDRGGHVRPGRLEELEEEERKSYFEGE